MRFNLQLALFLGRSNIGVSFFIALLGNQRLKTVGTKRALPFSALQAIELESKRAC